MASETVVHPEKPARDALAMSAIIEIEESAQLILHMLDQAGATERGQAPIRGVAIRLLDLAGIVLGAIDYQSDSVAALEATFSGTKSEPHDEVAHA